MQRYQQTNLTVAAFCEWEGVSPAAFFLWRKKLAAGSEMTPRQPSSRYQAEGRPVPRFVQIVPGVSPASCASDKVVMTLVDGAHVELSATDHQLTARSVVRFHAGIRQRCCMGVLDDCDPFRSDDLSVHNGHGHRDALVE